MLNREIVGMNRKRLLIFLLILILLYLLPELKAKFVGSHTVELP
jgi:hypothetical protein